MRRAEKNYDDFEFSVGDGTRKLKNGTSQKLIKHNLTMTNSYFFLSDDGPIEHWKHWPRAVLSANDVQSKDGSVALKAETGRATSPRGFLIWHSSLKDFQKLQLLYRFLGSWNMPIDRQKIPSVSIVGPSLGKKKRWFSGPSNCSAATKQVKPNTRERQRCKLNCSCAKVPPVSNA